MEIFDAAWNFDHFYPIHGDINGDCTEAWTTLAALAQATTRLRIGTMVNGMHYRHPAILANMAATLDIISQGRFNLGIGAGWFEAESDAYGIPLGTLTERFDRFDEGLEVISSLLTNEWTNFEGKYFQLKDARCEPKGVQSPRPPIVIGGKGPKRTLPQVARHADQWDALMQESPATWQALNEVLLGHCETIGRDPAEITRSVHLRWNLEADDAELADRSAAFIDAGVDQIVFSMTPPQTVARTESLAKALSEVF
jgi:F420-dependent oxidoreductase-like protein